MDSFALRRLAQYATLLILVSVIGFGVLHLAPGGPMAQMGGGEMNSDDMARLEHQLGLDQPLPVQYAEWLGHIARGDWGRSYRDGQPVLSVIGSHLGATLELMGTALLVAIVLGGLVGIAGAIYRYSWFDISTTFLSMVLVSIPTFWIGFVVIYFFSVKLGWLPAGNRSTIGEHSLLDFLWHLIAPATVLAIVNMASWSRYIRASMLEVIEQDYIRTARAKGLSRVRILFGHTLRNALLPMITIAGLHLPALLGGALVAETVFTWPGMGRLFLDSISYRDYPVIMGVLMFGAVFVLLGNFVADVLYGVVDPRVRLR
ncbi:diguanylate cyclase [Burkholderia sp. SG-MS1]|uniref:ABC transporter permease n=1 Tax=Paraburkholderia sp. SG-MS1 TaxID=2023741 RepID=UPI00144614E8|nr:ABC transporter permease [Paraburkholderia sp. SG-MS1]NKJ45626.1 diguanylate cyclase [Paraburkholderia sp. SG-MS1]